MNLPLAFVERMRRRLGATYEAFEAALRQSPPTTVRLHPIKGKGWYEEAPRIPWYPEGRILSERPDFSREVGWHAGAYYVQEASSMSVRAFLPPKRPLRVLDLSAAPGGKSTLILAELGLTGGLLIANDPDSTRRKALSENLERWGIPAYLVTGRDPAWWAEHYPEAFDVVLLDAPCSGEGLWRKEPRLVATWKPQLVTFCSRRSRRLLAYAQKLVAPGGRLIYATCTFAPEENEDNLAAFFREGPDWRPVSWPGAPVEPVLYSGGGLGYYFYPHQGVGEGFFISAWERVRGRPATPKRTSILVSTAAPLPLEGPLISYKNGQTVSVLTQAAFEALLPGLSHYEGFPLWRYHKPTHAAALLVGLASSELACYELPDQTAFLAFLSRKLFPLDVPYAWVHYRGLGIGWLYRGRPSLPTRAQPT